MSEGVAGGLPGLARRQGISDMLHRTASRVPGKLAIVCGATRLTFADLEAAASRTAAALAAEGLRKGDRLALLSRNCWQFAVLSFATARLGVILVPVNFMLGPGEIAYILGHSEASAFVAEDGLAAAAGKAIVAAGLDIRARAVIRLSGGEVPLAGPTFSNGSTMKARRRRSISPTTTCCGSCTPPAPSPGPRARCCRAAR